jgi:hypothetical protein
MEGHCHMGIMCCSTGLITDNIIPILSAGLPPDCNKQLILYREIAKSREKKTAALEQLLRFIPAVTNIFGCLTRTSMRTLLSRFINTKYLWYTVT